MSTETIVKCDSCGKQIKRYSEKFEVMIRKGEGLLGATETMHACSDQCFLKIANSLVKQPVPDVSKGIYR